MGELFAHGARRVVLAGDDFLHDGEHAISIAVKHGAEEFVGVNGLDSVWGELRSREILEIVGDDVVGIGDQRAASDMPVIRSGRSSVDSRGSQP